MLKWIIRCLIDSDQQICEKNDDLMLLHYMAFWFFAQFLHACIRMTCWRRNGTCHMYWLHLQSPIRLYSTSYSALQTNFFFFLSCVMHQQGRLYPHYANISFVLLSCYTPNHKISHNNCVRCSRGKKNILKNYVHCTDNNLPLQIVCHIARLQQRYHHLLKTAPAVKYKKHSVER